MPSSPDLYRGGFLSVTQVNCARIQCRALKRFACPLWALVGLGVLVVWSWHLIGRAFYCPIGPDGEIHTTLLNPMYTYHDLNDSYFLYVIRCLLWQLMKGIWYVDLTPIIHLVVFVSEGLTLVVYPSDLTLVICLFGFSYGRSGLDVLPFGRSDLGGLLFRPSPSDLTLLVCSSGSCLSRSSF